jgi:hypothetical protein
MNPAQITAPPEGWAKVTGGPTYGTLWVWDGVRYRTLALGGAIDDLAGQFARLNAAFAAQATLLTAPAPEE